MPYDPHNPTGGVMTKMPIWAVVTLVMTCLPSPLSVEVVVFLDLNSKRPINPISPNSIF